MFVLHNAVVSKHIFFLWLPSILSLCLALSIVNWYFVVDCPRNTSALIVFILLIAMFTEQGFFFVDLLCGLVVWASVVVEGLGFKYQLMLPVTLQLVFWWLPCHYAETERTGWSSVKKVMTG